MDSNRADAIRYFDAVAEKRERWLAIGAYYYRELRDYIRFLIPPGSSVLEIGCRTGENIAALNASRKVGIDISPGMIAVAKRKHPDITFHAGDPGNCSLTEKFDYVLLVNTIGYSEDLQRYFEQIRTFCRPDTRIVVVYFNYLWEPILRLAERLGLRMKQPRQHWLPARDIMNLLALSDFEVIKRDTRVLCPVTIPLISFVLNRILVKLPLFRLFALENVVIARPAVPRKSVEEITASVIIPCRNEKANIEPAVRRTPLLGRQTEIIFVEGHSKDGTLEECYRVKAAYPEKAITVLVQDGTGKADAVYKGFGQAKGDVLLILDADLTVPPEDLTKFFQVIAAGKGELIIGNRLVYRMEREAMRPLNLLANKFFGVLFTFLLEQRIRDTLCGTKVCWREDYGKIAAQRQFFGAIDPFIDFDLILGAAKINLKIVDIPVKYLQRTYGTTQIQRFRDGWLLLRIACIALWKIKFNCIR